MATCPATSIVEPTLSRAANAIASKAQVPLAMAAQSVLAVASLAASSHADVQLPFGQVRPLSLFFATAAASGDRKSTADNEALWPVSKREKNLRDAYADEIKKWRIVFAAWSARQALGMASKPARRDGWHKRNPDAWPNALQTKAAAEEALAILAAQGWTVEVSQRPRIIKTVGEVSR
jgi:hypothetical protein